MEPKNDGLEDVFPFQLGDFQGVMFESGVITRNPFSYQFFSSQMEIMKLPNLWKSLKINFLDVPLEVRINGDRISGLFHPNSSPIYK